MAQSDGHDAPGLIDELVPRHTAVVSEIVVRDLKTRFDSHRATGESYGRT